MRCLHANRSHPPSPSNSLIHRDVSSLWPETEIPRISAITSGETRIALLNPIYHAFLNLLVRAGKKLFSQISLFLLSVVRG